jgi:methyl-accepting chemotaxis protein
MKTSFRNKRFTIGMVVFLSIILLLAVSSAFFLNKLLQKTNAILKENHYSVVYASDMADLLTSINQEIVSSFLSNKNPDSSALNNNFISFDKSLVSEQNNITEEGEAKLVSDIEKDYKEYRNQVSESLKSSAAVNNVLSLQTRFDSLYDKLMLLSQMNEKAIEAKTDDARTYSEKATLRMTGIGTMCFLIAYAYTFILSSYFTERFRRLYTGIKDLKSSDYRQKLNLEGNDELAEIAGVCNEMAETINKSKSKKSE